MSQTLLRDGPSPKRDEAPLMRHYLGEPGRKCLEESVHDWAIACLIRWRACSSLITSLMSRTTPATSTASLLPSKRPLSVTVFVGNQLHEQDAFEKVVRRWYAHPGGRETVKGIDLGAVPCLFLLAAAVT